MAILELRAARSWSRKETADAFHLTPATITTWMRRLDESGPDALVHLPEPVTKFPDFVRYSVQQLKSLCPSMGKVKIAGVLARASLHLGSTTVGRIVKEPPAAPPCCLSRHSVLFARVLANSGPQQPELECEDELVPRIPE